MKLKKIFKDIEQCQIKGSKEVSITGISANSKLIAPGNLFIAKKGKTYDGNHYIDEAIEGGAHAVVTDLFNPALKQVVQIIHSNVAAIEGILADEFYQHPSQHLRMVGITGTNGKTTSSFIIKSLLDHFFGPCGLIGTIEYIIGNHRYPATHTTPDVTSNHRMLHEMIKQEVKSAVMEVTSHALDQGRVDNIDFDVAVFSNLTLDHLDYHHSMEKYAEAKKKIFSDLGKKNSKKKSQKWAIINRDSTWSNYLIEDCSASILSYGIENPADLQASEICLKSNGTYAKISYQEQSFDCFWPLVGRFNVYNCLAAIAVGISQNIPLKLMTDYMSHLPFIRGRLQPVKNNLNLNIYIDFAHTDDALENVLQTLKEIQIKKGRLIVVFGCGGDRDQSKRPKMAEVSEKYADVCIITSDNPRSEDPSKICEEIVAGFTKLDTYQIYLDRRVAIQKAIEMAGPEDTLLIAGKGHENRQIFAHQTIEFDDCQVVTEICDCLASIYLKTT